MHDNIKTVYDELIHIREHILTAPDEEFCYFYGLIAGLEARLKQEADYRIKQKNQKGGK